MRKVLRIITISAGIVSIVSATILGGIYLEDIVACVENTKKKLEDKITNTGEEYEFE